MKRLLITLFFVLILLLPVNAMNQIEIKVPDFRYPADVAKDANKTLKEAIAQRDGHAIAASLVQLALAKTSVSKKNVVEVCETIDGVLSKDQLLDPDIRALIYLLRNDLISKAPRNLELEESLLSVDWEKVINPLQDADISALQRPLSEYQDLIEPGNEWGNRCVPTLYDFLMMRIGQESFLSYELRQTWLSQHLADPDIMPRLFIEQYIAMGSVVTPFHYYNISDEVMKLYQKYIDYPESALFLLTQYSEDKHYSILKDYLVRHPQSALCGNVQNVLAQLEDSSVSLSYPSLVSSSSPIKVTLRSRNVSELTLTLYRLAKSPVRRSSAEMYIKDFTPVQSRVVKLGGVVPFVVEGYSVDFDSVPYGQYIVLASYDTPQGLNVTKQMKEDEVFSAMINVSDIRSFRISPEKIVSRGGTDYHVHDPELVFAVNAQTGAPVREATVRYSCSPRYGNAKKEYKKEVTNQDGIVSIEARNQELNYQIYKDQDLYFPEQSEYLYISDNELSSRGLTMHTDLGIYRPGETLHLSVVAWQAGFYQSQPVAGLALDIAFKDASGNDISTQRVTTDALGQALADFQIPTDRMNGQFCLRATSVDSKIYYSDRKYIDISEYKTPTFYVDLGETDTHQLAGGQVCVRGRIMTYSGMPVADTEVACRLSARSWMWWSDNADFTARNFTVVTDKQGNFEYTCPKEWFDSQSSQQARKPFLTYMVHATCTNGAGETHEGNASFWIGSSRGLSCSDGEFCLQPGKPIENPINLATTDPDEPAVRCHYSLSRVTDRDTTLVYEADFMSDDSHFDWDRIPSGEYLLRAHIIDDAEAQKAEAHITLFRITDNLPPLKTSLWVPQQCQKMDADGHVEVLIGNSTPSHIYYIIGSRDRILKSGWIYYSPGMHWFKADMVKAADEKLTLDFYTIYDGQSYHQSASFLSPLKDEVKLTSVSFRDKLQPASTERWTFHLTDQQGHPVVGGRMMLELFNEALQALAPNDWTLYTSGFGYSMHSYNYPYFRDAYSSLKHFTPRSSSSPVSIVLPKPNLYGHAFYREQVRSRGGFEKGVLYSTAASRAGDGVMLMEEAAPMASMKAANRVSDAEAEEETAPSKTDISVRTDEVKVALWQPQLVSDADGNFSIEFDVPDFNTTYHFQALAYDSRMKSDYLRRKVLAQRPLMVQSSLPRFLRAGDSIVLAANVMNATDSTLSADALIELFDPRTHVIIKEEKQHLSLEAHATEVVRIDYQAPQDAPYVGFRIKAADTEGNGDGEQQLLPILSNISPVIETQPFYLQPLTGQLSLNVLTPSLAKDGNRLTLEYCNNPTWYCLTALPTIIDAEAVTSPALAHNLFALLLTAKLSAENPQLAEAVRSWKPKQGTDADVLVSPLQTNEDLKISPLLASPWLPEAQRQQLRMQALDQLFDPERNERLTSKIISSLQRLQAKDGGFMWLDFDDSHEESSYWATGQVLELLGELHHLGCLPADAKLHALIADAMHYYDKQTLDIEEEMLKEAKKYDYKPSYLRFWSYIYVHRLLSDLVGYSSKTQGKALFRLTDKTLAAIEQDWGELQMTSRALAAVTLSRYERAAKARSIMESVRQFALHDPHKGMYWESLDESGFSPVACTAAMLQAFAEVSPRQEEIDEMREWLLLEKQTSDWGTSSMAIDAVYALLSTGSDWLHASSADSVASFGIRVDGESLDLSATDRYLGYVRVSLPAEAQKIEIVRSGVNPAWGALYHQFKAPMTEIRAQGVEELHISKQLARVGADGKGQALTEGDSLHVGDRVRITLHITAAKDLEYVTIIDQRPAFLEPVDQKSHYARAERFYYYLETKDMQTNAFITRLPDGRHTVSYECFVTAPGTFTSGIATIQSQYAPQFVAHSAGEELQVFANKYAGIR